jgi:hypothetical protein
MLGEFIAEIVKGILTGVTGRAFVGKIERDAARPALTTSAGDIVLVHSRMNGWVAFACLALFAIVAWLTTHSPADDMTEQFSIWAIMAISLGGGVYLGWEWLRFRCLLTDQGIDHRSAWMGRRFIALDDVASLTYSGFALGFILTMRDGSHRCVSNSVVGIRQFTKYCRRRLPREVWETARDGFAAVEGNERFWRRRKSSDRPRK